MLVIAQDGKPIYIQTTGNTALASREKELVGHGTLTHPDGFGSREIRRNQPCY
jgi:phenylalanine-4-hydroxylase